jgi:AcrR family transcriptional regulator
MPLARFEKIDPEKRQRILQAAAQEFAAEGFQKTSLGRIAQGAGVSKPALYYYFEDKADLYVTVVRQAWDGLAPESQIDLARITADDFWPALRRLVDANIEGCRAKPWLVTVWKLAFHPPREDRAAGAVAELFTGARDFLRRLVRRGQELGVVRDDLPDDLLMAMLTAADHAADHWLLDHWDSLGHEEIEHMTRLIFESIRGLLSPPGVGREGGPTGAREGRS